jgi:hypothetical protein
VPRALRPSRAPPCLGRAPSAVPLAAPSRAPARAHASAASRHARLHGSHALGKRSALSRVRP